MNGPSLSGKLAGLDPGITRFCQYEHWAKGSWTYRRSLFDSFASVAKDTSDQNDTVQDRAIELLTAILQLDYDLVSDISGDILKNIACVRCQLYIILAADHFVGSVWF